MTEPAPSDDAELRPLSMSKDQLLQSSAEYAPAVPSPIVPSDDLLPEGDVVVVNDRPRPDTRSPGQRWLDSLRIYPGPGMLESFGWIGAFFVVQIVGALFVLIGMAVAFGARNPKQFESLISDHSDIFLGLTMLITYLVLIPLGILRQRPAVSLKLNFSAPTLAQFLLALSLVMPLGNLADLLFQSSEQLLETLMGAELAALREGTDVNNALAQLKDAPLWVLVLVVAVTPAIGEEFLFRGLIGRGLINRYGLAFGITVTSILFACVHLYPPHVIAILPVGFVIHLVYLNTRSYWMPMLFHFVNNTLAVISLKYGLVEEAQEAGVTSESILFAGIGTAYVALGLWGLYLIRTRYFEVGDKSRELTDDNHYAEQSAAAGTAIPILGAEAPPPKLPIERRAPVAVGIAILATLVLIAQGALLWQTFS
ncbi:MAG: CPBP family intramembrane metalloprotease [Planctomycetaceae bacterium]|nr:CPBP family intramembrane metalloprotease [Planctomycetaceae bacterium]